MVMMVDRWGSGWEDGLPASLMIKGGCDTLPGVTQAKNPP